MCDFDFVDKYDPEIAVAMRSELGRQRAKIELIASENFVSRAVMAAMGSWLTNKYAEGYPSRRYYGGCECVDIVENIAIERANKLFGSEHANVQPHSGSQANMAVYTAVLKPGDTVLGMDLSHGGHLTHGSPVSFSGMLYNFKSYGVDEGTCILNYEKLYEKALEAKPKMIVAGASAYSRYIDFKKISEIAKEVGAYLMVDMAHIAGLVATGLHPDPVPYADFVTSTTHKTLRGPRGGLILCKEEYAKALDKAVFPGVQGGPLMHIIAAKAVAFKEDLEPSFTEYSKQILKNAHALSNRLIENGVDIVSGGTDNHLLSLDLRKFGVTGKVAEKLFDDIGITCNKNSIPYDPQSHNVTSGLRIGTPAVTTRGFKEEDLVEVADIICQMLVDADKNKAEATGRVKKLASKYPLYDGYLV